MPASNRTMIHKLQNAINQNGGRILYEKSQFFSEEQNRPVTLYRISQSMTSDTGKKTKLKLFESPSMIQIVLFLRDVWYTMNNKELPTDNEDWERIKELKHVDYDLIKAEVISNG